MTYREKLKMEHPEKVNEIFIGGCSGCPDKSKNVNNGCIPSEVQCTACWNRVIPGTEEKEYENLSREELITLVKLLEGRIETKDKVIANYTAACTDKNTRIEQLKNRLENKDSIIAANNGVVKELEQKIQKLEGACRNYNDEVNRLNKLLMVKEDYILDLRFRLNAVHSGIGFNPDLIDRKNKEIEGLKKSLKFEREHKDYWYNECHRLSKKVIEFENSNQELKDALAKEKSDHAKHHSLFSKYFAD